MGASHMLLEIQPQLSAWIISAILRLYPKLSTPCSFPCNPRSKAHIQYIVGLLKEIKVPVKALSDLITSEVRGTFYKDIIRRVFMVVLSTV